VSDSNRIFL